VCEQRFDGGPHLQSHANPLKTALRARSSPDESLEANDNLPPPDVIAAEIVEDLRAALEQFAEVEADLAGVGAE